MGSNGTSKRTQWEYFDRMVVFDDSEQGMVSGLEEWINDAGKDCWELVTRLPSLPPTRTDSPMAPSASTSSSNGRGSLRGEAPWRNCTDGR